MLVGLLAWLLPRGRKTEVNVVNSVIQFFLSERPESPTIQATNGVPTLGQLTSGLVLDAKKMGVAEQLYEAGLLQFNHYVNNRDGVIEESRREMESLANDLSKAEVSWQKAWDVFSQCQLARNRE